MNRRTSLPAHRLAMATLVAMIPVAIIVLLLGFATGTVQAADISVAGGCTLAEAITAANTDSAVGGCTAGSGADTIILSSDVLLTSINNTIGGQNGLPPITSTLTISGNGHTVARDSAAPSFRIFYVGATGVAVLDSLTVTNGIDTSGAGIYVPGGSLVLKNSTVVSNSAFNGGGVNGFGSLAVASSVITGNAASNAGGGITFEGTLAVTNTLISNNTAPFGAGVDLSHSDVPMSFSASTIANNVGSGILIAFNGDVLLANSTVGGNSGFGIEETAGDGGFARVRLINSTVTENNGGILNSDTVTMTNTIVASNTAGGGKDCDTDLVTPGTYVSLDHNLVGNITDCNANGPNDSQTSNPLLGPLQDNGGPTPTYALRFGSPAIDAGDNAVCSAMPINNVDQRGQPRPMDGNFDATATCDIGAYEFAAPNLVIQKSVNAANLLPGAAITYSIRYTNSGFLVSDSVVITDVVPVTITNPTDQTWPPLSPGAGAPFSWVVGSLAPSASGMITVTGILSTGLPAGHIFTNTVTITGTGDPIAGDNSSQVAVTIGNGPPIALDDTASTDEEIPVTVSVLSNDSDPNNDPLSVSQLGTPGNGQATTDGATVVYTPTLNFNGTDTFTYTVSDGQLSDTALVTVTVNPVPEPPVIALDKQLVATGPALDGIVTVGQQVTFTLTITNNSELALTTVPLTDTFDASKLVFVTASQTPDSSTGGTLVWNDVTGSGSLSPGAAIDLNIVFQAIASSAEQPNGQTVNVARAAGATDTLGRVASEQTSQAAVQITAPAIAIGKTVLAPASGRVMAGEEVTFTITITNTGDTTLVMVPVEDEYDADILTFVGTSISAPVNTITGSTGRLSWADVTTDLDNFGPGQAVHFTVTFRVSEIAPSTTNIARLGQAVDANGDGASAVQAEATILIDIAAMTLTTTSIPPADTELMLGQEISYTLTLTNVGSVELTNVNLVSTVPTGTTYVVGSASPPAIIQSRTANGVSLKWTRNSLPPGQVFVARFAVTINQDFRGNRVTNVTTAISDQTPPASAGLTHTTAPTAVELLFFNGVREEGGIRLTWITGREEALGFHLWRSEDGQRPHAQRITPSLIPAVGGVTGATYQFLDTSAQPDVRYTYWLQEITSGGSADDLGKITVGLPGEENQLFLPLVSH